MIQNMKKIIINFLRCGTLGWCIEIVFTSINALKEHNLKLIGNTSIWMFPIYGSMCLLAPFIKVLKKLNWMIRGVLYTFLIFTGEYFSGSLLMKKNLCPWDYSRSKWNINKVIRIDYAPFWFMTGLLYEHVLYRKDASLLKSKKP